MRKPLRSPTGKAITLPPIRPNQGIAAAYRKKLALMVGHMQNETIAAISKAWRKDTPEMVADAAPSDVLQRIIDALTKTWVSQFDDLGAALAEYFSQDILVRTDSAFKEALKKAGFTVRFTMTPVMRDALAAAINEQTGLIKSIASQYFTDVSGATMRAAAAGGDLKSLVDAIGGHVDLARIRMGRRPGESNKSLFARTQRRAAFIALDQTNKATATMNRARRTDLGITEAIWLHSHGGKTPRPEHVAADGKPYNIAKGMFLEGVWTWPGVQPRCRCVDKAIIPGD